MPAWIDGQKISQLEWGQLIGTNPSCYTVHKIGSTVYADCNVYAGTDYSGIAGSVDADMIQKAINALTVGRTSPEKVTVKGAFTVEKTISVPSYTILDLTGAKLTAKKSLDDEMLDCSGIFWNLSGGILDGNQTEQASGTVIKITGVAGSTARFFIGNGMRIINAKTYAIYALGTLGPPFCNIGAGTFSHLDIEDSAATGIALSDYTDDCILTNINIGGCDGTGFSLNGSGAHSIANSLFWNNLIGMNFTNGIANSISNCRIDWNDYDGIKLDTISDRNTFNGCKLIDNCSMDGTRSAIKLEDSDYNIITNCYMGNPGGGAQKYGVTEVATSDHNRITNNTYGSLGTAPTNILGANTIVDGTLRTAVSADLSGGATTLVTLHPEQACQLIRAHLLYTEASSADAGITVEIGKETDRDYYYTGTTEINKALWYSKTVTLLKTDIAAGDTVTFYSPGAKAGTGEIMLVIDYLTGA